MNDNQTLIAALELGEKGDHGQAIRMLASYASATGARPAMHVVAMAQMLMGLFNIFRAAVSSQQLPQARAIFDVTYGNPERWDDMYSMLAGTYSFADGEDLATWFIDTLKADVTVRSYVGTVSPYLPANLALMVRGHASETTIFRLIGESQVLQSHADVKAQYGSPEELLSAWGSHSQVLGLLRSLTTSGISAEGLDVLDLGCGSGLLSWHLGGQRSLVGVDIDPTMLDVATTHGRYNQLHHHDARQARDLTECDLILSAGVFQYFTSDEYELVFRFCHGNLRPGGYLALAAPSCSETVGEAVFSSNQHAVCDRLAAARAAAAGFSVVKNDFIPAVGTHRFRLLRKIDEGTIA